jgi:hypothetical protein
MNRINKIGIVELDCSGIILPILFILFNWIFCGCLASKPSTVIHQQQGQASEVIDPDGHGQLPRSMDFPLLHEAGDLSVDFQRTYGHAESSKRKMLGVPNHSARAWAERGDNLRKTWELSTFAGAVGGVFNAVRQGTAACAIRASCTRALLCCGKSLKQTVGSFVMHRGRLSGCHFLPEIYDAPWWPHELYYRHASDDASAPLTCYIGVTV